MAHRLAILWAQNSGREWIRCRGNEAQATLLNMRHAGNDWRFAIYPFLGKHWN